jgi:hypothetical protein
MLSTYLGPTLNIWGLKVGLGILQITFAKRCPQVWPWFGRSFFSTNFVEFDQAV